MIEMEDKWTVYVEGGESSHSATLRASFEDGEGNKYSRTLNTFTEVRRVFARIIGCEPYQIEIVRI